MMPGRSNSVNLEASASNREVAELSCENTCLPCVLVCVERDTGVPLSVRVTLAFGAAAGHAEPARVKTPIPIGYPPSQLTLIYNLLLVSCTTLLRLCQSFSIQRRAPRGHIPTPAVAGTGALSSLRGTLDFVDCARVSRGQAGWRHPRPQLMTNQLAGGRARQALNKNNLLGGFEVSNLISHEPDNLFREIRI